jgi:hypothetical protein
VFALLFVFCCSDPVEETVTPPGNNEEDEEETTPENVDDILGSFLFTGGTKVTGSLPTVANTSLIRTNSRDTIYTIPGIKDMMRISHPVGRFIKGIYIAAQGSSFYYDVPVTLEEESDTVSIVSYEFDNEEMEEPVQVPIDIVAYDEADQPIDVIERIITIEDPDHNNCSILQDGDTSNTDNMHGWDWKWSVILDMNDQLVNINAPGLTYTNDFNYQACCKGSACPALIYENGQLKEIKYDREFPVSTYYTIGVEWFEFYRDGTFYRYTAESSSAISNASDSTDWCVESPIVTVTLDEVFYYGTHDYEPGNTSISYGTTHSRCDDPLGLCGYGSSGGLLTETCHTMFIISNLEGQKSVRKYTRRFRSGTVGIPEDEIEIITVWED